MKDGIGDRFHQDTKYIPEKMTGGSLDWSTKPDLYKHYSHAPTISLPHVEFTGMCLHDVLKKRHSVRRFSPAPLSLADCAYLLWASTGIQRIEQGYEFRTAPSAGALYPIETYLVSHRVKDLNSGIYHYNIQHHQLEELYRGDFSRQIAMAALGQSVCQTCAAVFIWTAMVARCIWKYNQRAYRYIYLDAGHIAENFALAAVYRELGSCQIGAFFDEEVDTLLGIGDEDEYTVYLSVVGHPLR